MNYSCFSRFTLPCMLALGLLTFSSCKKDDNNDGGNNTPVNTTPTVVQASITLQGETHQYVFGQNGYNLQYDSQAFSIGDDTEVYAATSFVYGGGPGTTDEGYLYIALPAFSVPDSVWNADPAGAFIDYFSYPFSLLPQGSVVFSLPGEPVWNAFVEPSAGNWVMSYAVEQATSQALVRAHGEITIMLTNSATSETEEAQLSYTLKFQQPL